MRDFVKTTLASLLGLIIFCGLGAGALALLLVAVLSYDAAPRVKDQSVLVFDLSLNIEDTESIVAPEQLLRQSVFSSSGSDQTIALRTVLKALDHATRDRRITALYLKGGTTAPTTGLANLAEVRAALQQFRAAGKPIFAYDMDWNEREYYLGSVANSLVVNPFGTVELNGLSSQTVFLKGALQKYGVGVQVTRVGKYKSAVEPFLLTQSSPESRRQMQQLLGDVWGDFTTTVGRSRQLTSQQMQAIANNQGLLIAQEAQQQRLVDKLATAEQLTQQLKELTGSKDQEETFSQVSLKNYARVPENEEAEVDPPQQQIAVVYADGEIVAGEGGPGEIGSTSLAQQLRELRQNKDVKAIVLRINSPGGSVTASEIIQQEVVLTRKVKPVIASMGNVAASGGYWIATYADQIFAESNTVTGSIGVFGLLPNVQKLASDQGITWDTVKTNRYADIQTIARPKTQQELAVIQKVVDWIYDQFINKVAESRKLPRATVDRIAQGQVWSGKRAQQLRLVDKIGGIEQAIQAAAQRAKLGEEWRVEEYPNQQDLGGKLLKQLITSTLPQPAIQPAPVSVELQKLQRDLALLVKAGDPRGIYARLPFNLEIR